MTCNYLLPRNVNLSKIIYKKKQTFGNNNYVPIYYKYPNTQDKKIINTQLVIKTPELLIKRGIYTYNNKQYYLTAYLENKSDISDVSEFINFIQFLESEISTKKKYNRKKLKPRKFISLINEFNGNKKIYLPINLKNSECYDINGDRIHNWIFKAPTYASFLITIKNVWINEKGWGINIYTQGALVFPSQIADPDIMENIQYCFNVDVENFKSKQKREQEASLKICEHKLYGKYFKMLLMGVPNLAIKQRLNMDGLICNIINYPPDTPISKIKELRPSHPSNPPPPPPLPQHCNGKFPPLPPPIPSLLERDYPSTSTINNNCSPPSLNDILGGGALKNGLNKLKKVNKSTMKRTKSIISYANNGAPTLSEILNSRMALKSVSSKI